MPRTSVITLTHNKLPVTRRCLSGWLETEEDDWEIIVVDNGSTDGTREWLGEFADKAEERGVNVRRIFNPDNVGCSTARNMGIQAARGDYLVFADNDVTVRTRSWLQRLRAALDADAARGIVGPKLVYPYAPFPIQCAGAAVSPSGRVQFRGRGEPRDDPRFNRPCEVQCLISACFMFKRAVADRIGGLDEVFNPVEYEDLDFCYRARESGFEVHYEPSVEMYHFESVTTAGTASLPNTYLIIKHGMLFKERWRHMFEQENGPPDEATRWRTMPAVDFAAIGPLPLDSA